MHKNLNNTATRIRVHVNQWVRIAQLEAQVGIASRALNKTLDQIRYATIPS